MPPFLTIVSATSLVIATGRQRTLMAVEMSIDIFPILVCIFYLFVSALRPRSSLPLHSRVATPWYNPTDADTATPVWILGFIYYRFNQKGQYSIRKGLEERKEKLSALLR